MAEAKGATPVKQWLALVTAPFAAALGSLVTALTASVRGDPASLIAIALAALLVSGAIGVVMLLLADNQRLRADNRLLLDNAMQQAAIARTSLHVVERRGARA